MINQTGSISQLTVQAHKKQHPLKDTFENSPLNKIQDTVNKALLAKNIHTKNLGDNFSANNTLVGGRIESSQVFHVTDHSGNVNLHYAKEAKTDNIEPRLGKVTIDKGGSNEEIDFSKYEELTIAKLNELNNDDSNWETFIGTFKNNNKELHDALIKAKDTLKRLRITKASHEQAKKFRSAVNLVQAMENATNQKVPDINLYNGWEYQDGGVKKLNVINIAELDKELDVIEDNNGTHILITSDSSNSYYAHLYNSNITGEKESFCKIKLNNDQIEDLNKSADDTDKLNEKLLKLEEKEDTSEEKLTVKDLILKQDIETALKEFEKAFESEQEES